VCVLFAKDESYDETGAYHATFVLYRDIPTPAISAAFAKLGEAVRGGRVRQFSAWSSDRDAVSVLGEKRIGEKCTYNQLRAHFA